MTPPARRSGLLLPLFSMPSSRSWGIGEIGDIAPMARWLSRAGQRLLQLLPINEMPPGETSPYSALSAMAIDPQFIALDDLEDFAASGGEQGLGAAFRQLLDSVRAAPRVEYAHVRQLKHTALRRAFARFRDTEWTTGSRRAAAFRAYLDDQRWWLDDYGLFRALHARHAERAWTDWPEPLRRRDPAVLDAVREDLADDILYRQYLQWVADGQWARAREGAGDVALFGDLPFMVSGDSADVWARQDEFRLDASVGVPPDAFSETGQNWELPTYRWDVLAARDFDWLRHRARRNADLFDGYRVDHLVGFYRTYVIPHDGGQPQFTPEGEEAQRALGEQVLAVFRDAGAEIIAEDLGTVPDFVRESLARLEVPGYRVLRWEREWEVDGQPFRDPARYPAAAVATSGTHDTEPLMVWWAGAPSEEREAVLEIPYLREHLSADERARAVAEPSPDGRLREALLGTILASGAGLVILPMQDAFGWRDRINQPATVGRENWTWRLPWPVDRLTSEPEARAVAAQLREWSRASGR